MQRKIILMLACVVVLGSVMFLELKPAKPPATEPPREPKEKNEPGGFERDRSGIHPTQSRVARTPVPKPGVAELTADIQRALASDDPGARENAINGLLVDLIATDPAAAAAFAQSLPPGRDRDEVISQIVRIWLARDPASAEIGRASCRGRVEISVG